MDDNKYNIQLSATKALYFLLVTILVLLVGNIISIWVLYNFDFGYYNKVIKLLDFNTEISLPTYFSAFILLVSAILLYAISYMHKRQGNGYFLWLVLAIIFLFLSLDEIATLHERLNRPLRAMFNTSGILHYAWIIPYAIFVGALSVIYFKFVFSLPKKTRLLFILAAVIYLSGVIGIEMISGSYAAIYGDKTLYYAFLYSCEELCEMGGGGYLYLCLARVYCSAV